MPIQIPPHSSCEAAASHPSAHMSSLAARLCIGLSPWMDWRVCRAAVCRSITLRGETRADAKTFETHCARAALPQDLPMRSEEHTSELQSRLHLVCRLLLEKKKKNPRTTVLHR